MPEKLDTQKSTFKVHDCAFTPIATGHRAQTLSEFYEFLKIIPVGCIYHHFWRQTIDTSLPEGSFYNDFSDWAHHDLHDDFLAERLTWINPIEYADLENLRSEILQIIKKRIDEQEDNDVSLKVTPFYFVKSNIVVFNTQYEIDSPSGLVKTLPNLSKTSIFYHFVDARRRQPSKHDDFTLWLERFEDQYKPLIKHFRELDPYFTSLLSLQKKLTSIVNEHFL